MGRLERGLQGLTEEGMPAETVSLTPPSDLHFTGAFLSHRFQVFGVQFPALPLQRATKDPGFTFPPDGWCVFLASSRLAENPKRLPATRPAGECDGDLRAVSALLFTSQGLMTCPRSHVQGLTQLKVCLREVFKSRCWLFCY